MLYFFNMLVFIMYIKKIVIKILICATPVLIGLPNRVEDFKYE